MFNVQMPEDKPRKVKKSADPEEEAEVGSI
jgi:hypothetical protein